MSLAVMDNQQNTDGIGITAVTKLKHADLWRAAKKLGSQSALGRHLGLHPSEIGLWINLRGVPPSEAVEGSARWTEDYIMQLEGKLLALTGKSWEELFPPELRNNTEFLCSQKTIEKTAYLRASALEHYARATTERLSSPGNHDGGDKLRSDLNSAIKTLSYREREIIKLRYGLGDGYSYTLEEVGHIFKVSKDRIRQIEDKAIRKLQQPNRAGLLADHLPELDK